MLDYTTHQCPKDYSFYRTRSYTLCPMTSSFNRKSVDLRIVLCKIYIKTQFIIYLFHFLFIAFLLPLCPFFSASFLLCPFSFFFPAPLVLGPCSMFLNETYWNFLTFYSYVKAFLGICSRLLLSISIFFSTED